MSRSVQVQSVTRFCCDCVGDSYFWITLITEPSGAWIYRRPWCQACQKEILLDMVGMSMLFMVHRVYYYVHSYQAQSSGDCFYEGKEQINILEGSRLRNQENDCAYMAQSVKRPFP